MYDSNNRLPGGYRVNEEGARLRIRSPRGAVGERFHLFFSLLWNGFLTIFTLVALSFRGDDSTTAYFMLFFSSMFWAVGLYMVYSGLAGFLNRITIDIGAQRIRVRWGPLPWPGRVDLGRTDVEQLYVTSSKRRTRAGAKVRSFDLNAAARGGRKVTLVAGLPDEALARALEKRLERVLAVVDGRVSGEVGAREAGAGFGSELAVLPVPPAVDLLVAPDELRFVYRRTTWVFAIGLVFMLFWCSAVGFISVGGGLLFAILSLPLWLMGLVGTYIFLGRLVNRTTVRVVQGELHVSVGPLPWPGSRTVSVGEIDQLFVRERKVKHKHGKTYEYDVHLLDGRGGRSVLVSGFEKRDEALFMERKIEEYLGIADREIKGQVS